MKYLNARNVALAFAVGSTVYFWYQFRALAAIEMQINGQLQNVGLQNLIAPTPDVTASQAQAPYVAAGAALLTLLMA